MVHQHAPVQSFARRGSLLCWGSAFRFVIFLLAVLALPVRSEAQVDTGTIQGTVTDLSGAVIPGAVVTVTSEGTGLVMTRKSDGKGLFTFSPLHVGFYSVSAQAAGFGTLTREHLRLDVQQTLVADLALKVGGSSEAITLRHQPPCCRHRMPLSVRSSSRTSSMRCL